MGGLACVGGWRLWGLSFECQEGEGYSSINIHIHIHVFLWMGWRGVAWRWEIHIYEATIKIDIVQGE
jgi:hypothetical protein